ncbi:hypothetical protein [Erythrobacter colymbi]|uniref:hypothetical protein n=1 Tax=Erythrobacter colymbi TaxID=1161202 RepID=UPI000A3B270A|nr:hypothetical protein [Erythrobacter colymbi]
MTDFDSSQIEELIDRVEAIEQLTLAHALAIAIEEPDLSDIALATADSQIDPLVAAGRGRAAIWLRGYIEMLKSARD